jgi:hypothetical protein
VAAFLAPPALLSRRGLEGLELVDGFVHGLIGELRVLGGDLFLFLFVDLRFQILDRRNVGLHGSRKRGYSDGMLAGARPSGEEHTPLPNVARAIGGLFRLDDTLLVELALQIGNRTRFVQRHALVHDLGNRFDFGNRFFVGNLGQFVFDEGRFGVNRLRPVLAQGVLARFRAALRQHYRALPKVLPATWSLSLGKQLFLRQDVGFGCGLDLRKLERVGGHFAELVVRGRVAYGLGFGLRRGGVTSWLGSTRKHHGALPKVLAPSASRRGLLESAQVFFRHGFLGRHLFFRCGGFFHSGRFFDCTRTFDVEWFYGGNGFLGWRLDFVGGRETLFVIERFWLDRWRAPDIARLPSSFLAHAERSVGVFE